MAQLLADAHPSHLEKTSSEEGGALQRAKINFFVDTYFSKVNAHFFTALRASPDDKEKEAGAFVDAIVKEIEPQLKDAAPFFGGANKLTLAEVKSMSLHTLTSKETMIVNRSRSKLGPSFFEP